MRPNGIRLKFGRALPKFEFGFGWVDFEFGWDSVASASEDFEFTSDSFRSKSNSDSFTYNSDTPKFEFVFTSLRTALIIMFELTVFFAAHLMVITFYLRSRMWPFKNSENPDPRTTDDHFLVEILIQDNEKKLKALLAKTGAVELHVLEKDDH